MNVSSTNIGALSPQSELAQKQQTEKVESFSKILDAASASGDKQKLMVASQQFEAFFINTVLKSMRKSSEWGEGLLEKSHARGIYESMFDEKLADRISSGRGIGVSQMLYEQLSKRYLSAEESAGQDFAEDSMRAQSLDLKG